MHKCYARYTSIGQLFCESVVLLTADSNAICICTEHIGAQCYDMYNGTLIFKAMVHILFHIYKSKTSATAVFETVWKNQHIVAEYPLLLTTIKYMWNLHALPCQSLVSSNCKTRQTTTVHIDLDKLYIL